MKTYLFPTNLEANLAISYQKKQLTPTLSTENLPESYLTLLREQNGGYVRKLIVPTKEPTSDGLDYAYLHYVFGLNPIRAFTIPYQDFLPDYFIIFSAHQQQYFAFDYSKQGDEPSIRYIDTETDNWQTVAPNFTHFLEQLKKGEEALPITGAFTQIQANHAFLMVQDSHRLEALFQHLEAIEDKHWYFEWLYYFAKQDNYRQIVFSALETQISYFRLYLPNNAQEVFDLFPEKAAWIQSELTV